MAVEDYWEPGTRARRYAIGDLPRVTTPARRLLVMPELVARVVERAELGRIHADGRATLRCVFHDDRDPSAVVYPTGYWFCSACGISESASLWTRRGEVADWGLAGLVRYAQARRPELPEGHVKAPRSAIKIVAPVIAERATPLRLVRQRVGIRIVDADGKAVRYDDLDRLERDLRQLLGGLTYRVFWAAVALAQRAQRGGRFALETGTIADLLGYEPTTDGRHHTEVRDRVRKAIEALTRVWVRFRWSKGGPTFRGPLLVLHGDIDDRAAVFSLHLGIWRQMSGRSPAWVPWQIEALRLHEDALAVYLRALWEYQDSREGKAGQPLRIRLRDVAERAGVWNEERWTKDRKRYLDEWATRMEPAHGLGFGICYLENEAFLVAEPKLMGRFSRKDGTVFAETTLRSPRRPPTSETLVRVQGTSPLRALPSASPPAPASPLQVVRVLPVSTPASETNLAAALDLLLGKDDDPDHGAPPRHPVGSRSPAV